MIIMSLLVGMLAFFEEKKEMETRKNKNKEGKATGKDNSKTFAFYNHFSLYSLHLTVNMFNLFHLLFVNSIDSIKYS